VPLFSPLRGEVHNPVQIIDHQRPDCHVVGIHPTSFSTPPTHTEPQASHGRLRPRYRDPRRSRQRVAPLTRPTV
jgi:hypothetical protein